ncbi:MAG: OmpH family outer membrane protein [Bacteroidetes bacterium]|nr:OmpH family outer membrane protein [Bacteroidota bacterium]
MKNSCILLLVLLTLACSTNNIKEKKADTKPTVISRYDNHLVVAFYYQDSLKEGFTFYKREDKLVTQKQKSFEAELQKRTKELEDYIRRNDDKARNGLLSQNEIVQIQQKAQSMEQQIIQYQQSEGARLEQESMKKIEAITKKIEVLGKAYCEKNNIDILLIHGVGGQLNFINAKMNVTADFIRYLNENQASIEKDLK